MSTLRIKRIEYTCLSWYTYINEYYGIVIIHYSLYTYKKKAIHMYMSWQVLWLFFRAAWTTFIPWLIPFLYAAIAGLVMQWMDPLLLSVVLFGGAAFGTTCLWVLDRYLDVRLNKRFPNIQTYTCDMNSRLGRMTAWIHDKLHVVEQKPLLFILSCCMTWSAIPDLVVIRCVRKKLWFSLFFLATLIGKAFVYTPVIYSAELIDILIGRFF